MDKKKPIRLTRREILRAFLAMPATLVLAACAAQEISNATPTAPTSEPPAPAPPLPTSTEPAPTATSAPAPTETPAPTLAAQALPPTPACGDDDDEPTLAQTEGPYYTPNTPERTSLLEPGIAGTKMVVTGYVLSTSCQPVAQALVDFWHCDAAGVYDNEGYHLRGHQFTDEQGRYYLETIVPGVYPGRTRHIHVKVQAPQSTRPDHPDVLSKRADQCQRWYFPPGAADGHAGCERWQVGGFQFCVGYCVTDEIGSDTKLKPIFGAKKQGKGAKQELDFAPFIYPITRRRKRCFHVSLQPA